MRKELMWARLWAIPSGCWNSGASGAWMAWSATYVSPLYALIRETQHARWGEGIHLTDDLALVIDGRGSSLINRDTQMGDFIWLYSEPVPALRIARLPASVKPRHEKCSRPVWLG